MTRQPAPSVAEQLAAAGATIHDVTFVGSVPTRQNKYGNEQVETEEGTFDSKLEYHTWLMLKDRQAQGEISNLRRQVRYPLHVGGMLVTTYIADFVFTEEGREIEADAKGKATREYILKAKLMKACLGITIREYRA